MKKISRTTWLVIGIVAMAFIFVSCSKEGSSTNNGSAVTKENIAGSYLLTAATGSVTGLPPQNIYDSIPTCQQDDIYKLNLDYTMEYIDAGTKCVPPGDDVSTWSLSGTTKIIIGTDTATIQSFNGKTLVVSSVVTIVGIPVTTTDTFTKQ